MKKLLYATVALVALALPAQAALVKDLGINPTSAQGNFSNSVGGSVFLDQYSFQLVGEGMQFISFSSATNVYTDFSDFISNFAGRLYEQVGAIGPAGGDDIAVGPLVTAQACPGNPTGCQLLAGAAILDAGSYYLLISGAGGGTAGYGGNLTTAPVVPIPGMALAVPLGALGLAWFARRRKRA